MKALLLLPFLLSIAGAQTPVPIFDPRPMTQVQSFLGLSNSQVSTILRNNLEYNLAAIEKQNRIRQVQSEIAEWTSASNLDPMQLGIRYMEIEQLCRQMKDAADALQKKNLALLNDAQKAKLKILDDAVKLMPVITEAQSSSLLGNITTVPYSFTSTGSYSFITGSLLGGGVSGCYSPVPTAAFRNGDFSGLIPAP